MATSGEFSGAGAAIALDAIFNSPTVYLALLTAAPSDSTTPATMTEEDDATYSRQNVTSSFADSADNSGVQRVVSNADITFGPWTAEASSAITHCALVTSSSGTSGSIYYFWEFATSKTPGAGDTLTIASGNLIANLD